MNWTLAPSSLNDSPTTNQFTSLDGSAPMRWSSSQPPNSSNESCKREPPDAAFQRTFEVSTKSAFIVLSVTANLYLLVMLFRFGNMRSRAILFMANLCTADLAVSLLSTLTFMLEMITHPDFKGGAILCKLVRYLQLFGPYAASYAIVSMGVDRYLAIVHPLSNYSRSDRLSHAGWLLGAPWLLSALLATPQLFLFKLQPRSILFCASTDDSDDLSYKSTAPPILQTIAFCSDIYEWMANWSPFVIIPLQILFIYFIPAVILVYSYSTLSRQVWSSYNVRALLSNGRHNPNASTSTASSYPLSSSIKSSATGVEPLTNHLSGGRSNGSIRHPVFTKSFSLEPAAPLSEPNPLPKPLKAQKASRLRFFGTFRRLRFTRVRFSTSGAVALEQQNSNESNGTLRRRNGFGSIFGFHIRRAESSPSIRDRALTPTTQSQTLQTQAHTYQNQQTARASLDKAPSTARTSNASEHLCDDSIQALQMLNYKGNEAERAAAGIQVTAVGGTTEGDRPVLRGASKRRSRQAAQKRAHIRTLMITFVIVMLFILSWAPFAIAHLLWLIFPHIAQKYLMVKLGVSLCSCLNSCLDPLIYMAFHLRSLFKRRKVARTASASGSRGSYRSRPPSTAACTFNQTCTSPGAAIRRSRPLSVTLSAGATAGASLNSPLMDKSWIGATAPFDPLAANSAKAVPVAPDSCEPALDSSGTPKRSAKTVVKAVVETPFSAASPASSSWVPLQAPRNVLRCVSVERGLMRGGGADGLESPCSPHLPAEVTISQQLLLQNSSESDTLRALKRCVSEEMERELECGADECLFSSGPEAVSESATASAAADGADGPLGMHINFEFGGRNGPVSGTRAAVHSSRSGGSELLSVRHAPSAERLCAFKSHNVTVVCGIANS